MASNEDSAPGAAGTIRLVFARDEPLTLEALQALFDRHRVVAAAHDLEVCLAGDGFALRQLRHAA